jgi:hypothetical protein
VCVEFVRGRVIFVKSERELHETRELGHAGRGAADHLGRKVIREIRLTSIPVCQKTYRAEKNNKYFDFKHLKLYTQIDVSNSLSVPLFFSYPSIRIRFAVRKYHSYDYAVNCPVDGVESRFSRSPPLYYEYRPVSKFREYNPKLLLRKNNASKL